VDEAAELELLELSFRARMAADALSNLHSTMVASRMHADAHAAVHTNAKTKANANANANAQTGTEQGANAASQAEVRSPSCRGVY
jgi:hypothetical protein